MDVFGLFKVPFGHISQKHIEIYDPNVPERDETEPYQKTKIYYG